MIRTVMLISMLTLSATAMAAEASSTIPVTRDGMSGKDIYEGRCAGACHQSPPLRSLSRTQWSVVLKTMRKRMQSKEMEPLSEEETRVLLDYLAGES